VLTVWLRRKLEFPGVYWGLLLLAMPLTLAVWRWLQVACHRYEVDGERITVRTGVLSRTDDTVELYRVKDVTLERPLIMRLCGLGNVTVISSDKTMPTLTFYAVRGAAGVADLLRRRAEARRSARGVRELDVE
jgi:membrane protein YdbS with pleckstrin-like domain